jgi:aryl-alcohol dehydrogenase-like predicted oxidoreductase
VSELGLGCARIGGIFQQERTREFNDLLAKALEGGINFFDTADIYSQGESEVLLGRAFRRHREQIVIASKAGYVLPAQRKVVARLKPLAGPLISWLKLRRGRLPAALRGSLAQDFSARHIERAVEGSLRRLRTDRLDLFQLHSPPLSIVEHHEPIAVLERLKQQGKIRYYGVSCDSSDVGQTAAQKSGVSSIQVPINLLEQIAVDEVLPSARRNGVAVIARECLANGLLVKEQSLLDLSSYCRSEDELARKTRQLKHYRALADERGCTLSQLALQFVRSLPDVTVVLIGVSRLSQLEALLTETAA